MNSMETVTKNLGQGVGVVRVRKGVENIDNRTADKISHKVVLDANVRNVGQNRQILSPVNAPQIFLVHSRQFRFH